MRVLHVDTARGWRGGQNQVLLTTRGQAARGHEVALACQRGGVLEGRAREAGVTVRPLAFRGDLWPPAILALGRVVSDTRPDVLHLHDPHALSSGLLALALTAGRPAVASRRVDFPLRGLLSRRKYAGCRRVIAVSRAIARVLQTDGIPPDRIRVVYEGVADRPPQPGGRAVLTELGIPEDAPVVGNVAALTDHKDQATLVEAAVRVHAHRPDVRFVILGEGEKRRELEARIRARALEGVVVLGGFRNDLDRLVPVFSLFCLSSRLEGLGTSLLDAMAFGLPVVATAAGGIPEAVEDGVTGRVVPTRDPEALAAAILDVLPAGARQAMGAAGRRRFEERFTAERMVDETLKVYQEIL
jgi:glycosyltransferase involved in cell wall biosynthesis